MKHYVGDFGTFQLLALLIAGLSAFIGNDSIANNFIAGEQEHWCFIPELEHIPHDQQKEIAIPYDEESDGEEKTYSSCTAFKLNYSEYTTNDFYYWNRSMYDSATTYECTSWVYDQSLYVNTITSKVLVWNLYTLTIIFFKRQCYSFCKKIIHATLLTFLIYDNLNCHLN